MKSTLGFFMVLAATYFGSYATILAQTKQSPASIAGNATSVPQAGPYDVNNGLEPAEREEALAKIRSFLWERFAQRQAGRLQATFYTIEGEPTLYTFVVTIPDDKKACIKANIVSCRLPGSPSHKKPVREDESLTYCDVNRLEVNSDATIPYDQIRDPKTYKLRLYDVSKKSKLTL